MTCETYTFEEPTADLRFAEVAAITQKAVDAGLGYTVRLYRTEGGWHGATVTVDAAKLMPRKAVA